MMNIPFYRNNNNYYYSKPPQQSSSSSSLRSVPAKVVSVPVHFISSGDQPQTPALMSSSRDSAALKIQKVFRGFLVRKSVNNISSVRNEVVNIEQMIINNEEFINSIRDDDKERLRVNERLMCLLLKLDSIRGFDCGVRDFRKSVTKKAIALQEKVDSIVQQPDDSNSNERSGEIDVDVKENSCVGKEEEEEDCGGGCSMKDDEQRNDDEMMMMKVMMMKMCERNEMQRRMINSLSRRVEQLEKTFDRLTRTNNNKKKKTNTNKYNAAASSRRRIITMRDKDNFDLCI